MADDFKACSIDGCNRSAARAAGGRGGLCRAHNKKKMRYGDPLGGRKSPTEHCAVDDCSSKPRSLGFCTKHYQRFAKHGDAKKVVTPKTPARDWLEAHVAHDGDDCLIWPFYRMRNGYGQVVHNGRRAVASRAMCELAHGAPPSIDMEAAHSCGRGREGCVNPRHLRWATASENQMDRVIHGTSNRGERQGSSKLTRSEVLQIRSLAKEMSARKVAKMFGISHSHVQSIAAGHSWQHLDGDDTKQF